MKWFWAFILLFIAMPLSGQYVFQGQVSDTYKNRPVYLSLVEDYRKSSRVYMDQIVQKVQSDSLGHFSFEGDNLFNENRIYRIHTDGCSEEEVSKKHFLRECSAIESLLFIANNRDTVELPLGWQNQAFCEIVSTNTSSSKILEVELLKEDMILDFIESDGDAAMALNLEKWFKKFQDFGKQSNEPLAELYSYAFLSDRASETHEYYKNDLIQGNYYDDLLERLTRRYSDAPFVTQLRNELRADKSIFEDAEGDLSDSVFNQKYLLIALAVLGFIVVAIFFGNRKRKPKKMLALTQQEQRIYEAIRLGKTNKEIAAELFISLSTVKTHINNIYKKLGITSRNELR